MMTKRPFRFGTGFMLNNEPFNIGPNPRAFGHPGVGGAIGFADPDAKLGFSYCCNRMAPVADRGPFAGALIDAAYASL
jgi:CubicO group peptidase (beta-lactamase class C family)